MLHPYYHISFNGKLAGVWQPKTPQGFEHVTDRVAYDDNMAEPRLPRICLANTVEGCFKGVYPNVYQLYGRGSKSKLHFYVYRAFLDTSANEFVSNAKITHDRLVWDAHLTGEVWWLGELRMQLYQAIQVSVDNRKPLYGHPFADKDYPQKFCSYEPTIEVVKRYPAFYEGAS